MANIKAITEILDTVASSLERRGFKKEANQIDVVSNTIEAMALGPGAPVISDDSRINSAFVSLINDIKSNAEFRESIKHGIENIIDQGIVSGKYKSDKAYVSGVRLPKNLREQYLYVFPNIEQLLGSDKQKLDKAFDYTDKVLVKLFQDAAASLVDKYKKEGWRRVSIKVNPGFEGVEKDLETDHSSGFSFTIGYYLSDSDIGLEFNMDTNELREI